MRILTQPPDLDGIPPALREIVARALSKEPDERPTARELVDLLVGGGPTALSDGAHLQRTRAMMSGPVPADRPGRAGTRVGAGARRGVLKAVALVVLVAVGLVGLYLRNNGRAGPTRAGDALAAAAGASTPTGPRTIIQDSLSPPQVWKDYASKTLECTFDTDVRLFIVGTDKNTSQRCPGPAVAVPADQVISLEVGMQSADSCASIWWLDAGAENYQLVLCPDTFFVQRNFGPDAGSQPLAGARLKTPIVLGTPNRVVISIKDYIAEVDVNGTPIGRAVLSDRSRTSGKISLGIDGRGDGKAAGGFGVTFGNLKVVTPS